MDFLTHSFKSKALQDTQAEVNKLVDIPASTLIMGDSGSGKTSWALAIAKAKGSFLLIEANQAPKNVKDWRALINESQIKVFVFEDIEKWNEMTQNSFSFFLREQFRLDRSFISTASFQLMDQVRQGSFRNDLYHRLCVRPLTLPRLSECVDDLKGAIDFWMEVHCLVAGRKKPVVSEDSIEFLASLPWQSDWSEFVSVLERALTLCEGILQPEHLILMQAEAPISKIEAGLTLAEMEKKLILQTLKLTASNKSQAARLLGISIRTLRNKLNEYKQEGFHELV